MHVSESIFAEKKSSGRVICNAKHFNHRFCCFRFLMRSFYKTIPAGTFCNVLVVSMAIIF